MHESALPRYLFFSEDIQNTRLVLFGDEARHASRVLRVNPGDTVEATDGKGGWYTCTVRAVHKDRVDCHITNTERCPRGRPQIHLYVGLPAKQAFERCVELVVPVGIASVTPLICTRGQRGWWEKKWPHFVDRMTRKIRAGITQSLQPWEPALQQPAGLECVIRRIEGTCVVADMEGAWPGTTHTGVAAQWYDTCHCVVGPPGGFTAQEKESLASVQTCAFRIARHRLRTELAAALLCAALQQHYEAGDRLQEAQRKG